jgi:hypothetical protein
MSCTDDEEVTPFAFTSTQCLYANILIVGRRKRGKTTVAMNVLQHLQAQGRLETCTLFAGNDHTIEEYDKIARVPLYADVKPLTSLGDNVPTHLRGLVWPEPEAGPGGGTRRKNECRRVR